MSISLFNEAANLLWFAIRECCPAKKITLHTVPFEQIEPPHYHGETSLQLKNITLNPRVNFHLPNPNVLHRDRIEAFLSTLNPSDQTDRLIDRLFNEVEMIEMKDLSLGLALCCKKINQLIESKYALGLAHNKSQTFTAELALPFLKTLPVETFSVATDDKTCAPRQSTLTKNVLDHVVFDDASYSGHQLRELIYRFSLESDELTFKTPRLFLAVPFISSTALKVLNQMSYSSNLEVHIVTTNRRIKAIGDKFTSKETPLLAKWLKSIYKPEYLCLSMTEWKIADGASIPEKVAQPDNFVTKYPEFYKSNY